MLRARPRRRLLRVVLAAVGLLVLAGAWLAWSGLEARRHLEAARASVTDVRSALAAADVPRARAAAATLSRHTGEARALTDDPLWTVVGAVPLAGDNAEAVSTVAEVSDRVASDVLPRFLDAGASLDPETLRPSGDRIAIDRLRQARPALDDAAAGLSAAAGRVHDLRDLHLLPAVGSPVAELDRTLARARDTTTDIATLARLLPPMLGGDEPRRYLVAFQNNAEARGTGGLFGGYGVLSAREGRVDMLRMGPPWQLQSARTLPVDLGRSFRERYGNDPSLWQNANMSPHFPYAARIWLALWERQTGERLDGVIATDPVALGYVLGVAGPVTLPDGSRVTGENAARFTMREVYERYPRPGQNTVRDMYLQQVARGSFDRLVSGQAGPRALYEAMSRAASQQRLLVYSTHPAEQRLLARSDSGGVLTSRRGPYVAVVVNNGGGNKLDYYLDRTIRYERFACDGERQRSRLTAAFGNAAPGQGLPAYVKLRGDDAAEGRRRLLGHNKVLASVFLPVGSRVQAAALDGGPLPLDTGTERGRPVVSFPLDLAPGERRTVVLYLDEPSTAGKGRVWTQPLVRQPTVDVRTSDEAAGCGG